MREVHAQMSQLAVDDVANKPIALLSVDEVVRVTHKCMRNNTRDWLEIKKGTPIARMMAAN